MTLLPLHLVVNWPVFTILYTIEAIEDDADIDLFRKMANPRHCVHSLIPPVNSSNHYNRPNGHTRSQSLRYNLTEI